MLWSPSYFAASYDGGRLCRSSSDMWNSKGRQANAALKGGQSGFEKRAPVRHERQVLQVLYGDGTSPRLHFTGGAPVKSSDYGFSSVRHKPVDQGVHTGKS